LLGGAPYRDLAALESQTVYRPSRTYQNLADAMWYVGHVMALGSLLSRESLVAAAVLMSAGQALVIASRPIGRTTERVADDTA
jgi:hypothetical protein